MSNARKYLLELIVDRYGVTLKGKDVAEILGIPAYRVAKIPRTDLPRAFARGRGGVRVPAQCLVYYIYSNMDEISRSGIEAMFERGELGSDKSALEGGSSWRRNDSLPWETAKPRCR